MRKLFIVVVTLLIAGSVTWAAEKTMGDATIKASKVIGQTVKDSAGEDVGTLEELLLDQDGRVSKAVLSVGGFMGMGDKRVAVSWDNLTFQPKEETITINQRKEDLTKAPSYRERTEGRKKVE